MGSKGSSRQVYDYLMSVDYGVCAGPVDSINQVIVKDKPIFCGWEQERTDKSINLTDLFGGDDGEGGVKGVCEVYVGSDDQVASTELASRVGRTPANMPGYRGLAHLFFRGFNGNGFRWSSNNPYLPAVKVNATRLPKTLGESNKEIMPPVGVAEDGSFTPAQLYVVQDSNAQFATTEGGPPGQGDALEYVNATITLDQWHIYPGDDTLMIDLLDLYPTQGQIDQAIANGAISVTARAEGYCNDTAAVGGPKPGQMLTGVSLGVFRDNGSGQPDLVNPAYENATTRLSTGAFDVAHTPPMPNDITGARFLRIRVTVFPASWQTVHFDGGLSGTPRQTITVNYEQLAVSHCQPDGTIGVLPDANPAHIIHECLVNAEWGKGEDPALINVPAFQAAAQIYFDEFMGLSLGWHRQSKIEDFIGEILDHTNTLLFQDPATGQWTPIPLRDNYAEPTIVLNKSNSTLRNRKRRAWGDTVNEIVVQYTDPQTEKQATVTAHNLGNIAIQGGVISETRDYYGVRSAFLAQVLADRDVEQAGYPLFSCQADVGRAFWTTRPGDVLKLTSEKDGIVEMIVRVMKVNYGSLSDRKIKLDLVEDIFAVEQTTYRQQQGSEWESGVVAPSDMTARVPVTTPLPLLVRNGLVISDLDADYPSVNVLLMTDQDPDPIDVQAHTAVTKTNGSSVVEAVSTFPIARSTLLDSALAAEVTSRLPVAAVNAVNIDEAEVGDILMLGSAEAGSELVMLDSFDEPAQEWVIVRGLWDSVPREWPVGARLWQFPSGQLRSDPTVRAGGESITYWFLPRTQAGRLDIADATATPFTATERPHAPFRPANAQLDGNGFGETVYNDAGSYPTEITATWANRNRASEDVIALAWNAASATPETGQTTVLRFLDETGAFQHEITGLTGTSRAITIAEFQGVELGFIEFVSERDGIRSWDGARRAFDIRLGGYGENYGNFYGP